VDKRPDGSDQRFGTLRRPRLAEAVAAQLREQIVSGELGDGDALPPLERLMEMFGISAPSIREALRILENEGLITVRRGNVGGAVIHKPNAENAAYMLGLVLQSRDVPVVDVARALANLEPLCARLCAERADRDVEVLPNLGQLHEEMTARLTEGAAYVQLASRFHRALVSCCGNESIILIVGSLEWLWSTQSGAWFRRATLHDESPDIAIRRTGLTAHARILEAIAAGNGRRAEALVRRHVHNPETYELPETDSPIVRATDLRGESASLLDMYSDGRPLDGQLRDRA
jgi:DNA-binding FadR family transcriptional regulator